jgi:hypothetical protein
MLSPFPWKSLLVKALVTLAPAGAAGVLKPEIVQEHPYLSALAFAGWALVVWVGGLIADVWKELWPKWKKRFADWLDAQVQRVLSGFGFRRRYYQQLLYRHRVFNVRGLRTQGTYTLELEKVFVELRIAPQNPQDASANPLRGDVQPGNRSIWDFLVSNHEAYRCLAIVGPPGSGKTTLLQHLMLVLAQNKQRRVERRCHAFVPIFLFLRDHIKDITVEAPPTLAELATAQEAKGKLEVPPSWFESKLKANKCLVLLDGLDEVADLDQRKKVVDWVDEQMRQYGGNRFLITSRPHGYRSNPLRQATILEVQPFTAEQVERFVTSWYLASEVLSSGKSDPGVRDAAAKNADDLLHRLRSAPRLAVLAVNPLLLTMISMVHRYRGALPGRRVELYAEICDVLLGHWQAAKGISATLTPAQKRSALEPLAAHMMKERTREIATAEATKVIRSRLEGAGIAGRDAPATFLREVEKDSGLLLEREAGVYAFAHQTFQEYLAATHFVNPRTRGEELLIERVNDPWWHETIRLYAAQADATAIIRACLDNAGRSVMPLTLAYDCINEGRYTEPEVRERLQRELIDGLESDDPEHGRLAAQVLLTLRVQNLLRVSDSVEIDTSYVSCAEYQLFLDDIVAAGWGCQPDHWQTRRFRKGQALQPVTGVRYADAVAFCEWLTKGGVALEEEAIRFRLPTPAEARSHPVHPSSGDERFRPLRSDAVGTWCDAPEPEVIGFTPPSPEEWGRVVEQRLSNYFAAARHLAPGWARILETSRARVIVRALDLARGPALDINRDLDLVRALSIAVARDRGRDRDRALLRAFALAPARDVVHDLDLARDLDRDLPPDLARARAFDLALVRDRDPVRALDLALALGFDIDLHIDIDSKIDSACERALIRRYCQFCLAHYAFVIGERVREEPRAFHWLQRPLRIVLSRKTELRQEQHTHHRDAYLTLFWSLAILQQRIEGNLPAWEGIRIVRERIQDDEPERVSKSNDAVPPPPPPVIASTEIPPHSHSPQQPWSGNPGTGQKFETPMPPPPPEMPSGPT